MADFNKTFPAIANLAGLSGEDKLAQAGRIYAGNKTLFDALFKILGGAIVGLIHKKQKPAQAPVAVPVAVPSVTFPAPVEAPPVPDRFVSALDLKLFFVEKDKKQPVPEGDELYSKEEADAVRQGKGNVGFGMRVHFDTTPIDQFGKPFEPGDPENAQLLRADGYPAFEEVISYDGGDQGPVGLSSEYDDFGCTPVLKVPKSAEDKAQHTVRYLRRIVNARGVTVASNAITYNVS